MDQLLGELPDAQKAEFWGSRGSGALGALGVWFRVEGLGFRGSRGFGFRVEGLGFRGSRGSRGLGLRV